jgi:hypothetical protein
MEQPGNDAVDGHGDGWMLGTSNLPAVRYLLNHALAMGILVRVSLHMDLWSGAASKKRLGWIFVGRSTFSPGGPGVLSQKHVYRERERE